MIKAYSLLKKPYFAYDDAEFVKKLHAESTLAATMSIETWMENFSNSTKVSLGVDISFDKEEIFVEDLKKFGILKVELAN